MAEQVYKIPCLMNCCQGHTLYIAYLKIYWSIYPVKVYRSAYTCTHQAPRLLAENKE